MRTFVTHDWKLCIALVPNVWSDGGSGGPSVDRSRKEGGRCSWSMPSEPSLREGMMGEHLFDYNITVC
jgi:hypothetical protein